MRSFIAIDLPPVIKEAIKGVVRELSPGSSGIRWVPVENIHLTIKFLGEVKEDLVPMVEKQLRASAERHQAFTITIKGAGAFPNLRSPNVLWIGIEASDALSSLFRDIDAGMSGLGFELETRRFSPHLTIGRITDKNGTEPAIRGLSTYKDTVFGTIGVQEIRLMKSVLKPSGAEYSSAADIRLK
jgi:RNA 2',3'-cyclic 3'-phosphodiesterase